MPDIDRPRRRRLTWTVGISPEGIMRKRSWIGVTLMIVAIGTTACAGMSDEERCKRDGGVWKSKACEMQTK